MKKAMLILVTILTSLQIGCASKGTDTPVETDNRDRLVVFGDSISYCQLCFPTTVAKTLDLKLTNLAVPGTVIENGEQYNRIMEFEFKTTDRVLFLTGYNNMRGLGAHTGALNFYRAYLNDILKKMAASNAQIYIGTVMDPLCVDAPSIARNGEGCTTSAGPIYAQIIRDEVAALNAPNVHLVDVNAQWVPSYSNLSDMVHPTTEAYVEIAQMFLAVMQ